jgi:5-methylcytosine-specific restriction protein A
MRHSRYSRFAQVERQPFSIPHGILPTAVPTHIVCGAPAAGKTTFVRENKQPLDFVIDFEDIRQKLGAHAYASDPPTLHRAFQMRSIMLKRLSNLSGVEAWFTVMAPTMQERMAWLSALGSQATIHLIECTPEECKRRIYLDHCRAGYEEQLCAAVDLYFRNFSK